MTTPDHACLGKTGYYYVIPGGAASTFTWWIDGNVVEGSNTGEFSHSWNYPGTFLLEVREQSAEGCMGPKGSGFVYVNPEPEIQVGVSDTVINDGENVTIRVQKASDLVWGQWIYDLLVEPDQGISGNSISASFSSPSNLSETLFNSGGELQKVIYRFIPAIVTDDGVNSCIGREVKITIWVYPVLKPGNESLLKIPDAFSPNGDGVNDYWNIGNTERFPEIEVFIYNRWGQLVWRSGRGFTAPWDGKFKGRDLPVDSYHYLIDLHNGSKPLIGDITIVR